MSEIEKMYKNAGIEPISEYCKHQCNLEFNDNACIGCKYIEKIDYPPFTAEKQIELIKFLLKNYEGVDIDKSFEESLAEAINEVWADMPEEYQQQVKGILND